MARGRRRKPLIPQRVRVFFGCEGQSERGYARLLQGFADDPDLCPDVHVHLDSIVLQPGGGDPLELVRRARKKIRQGERHARYAKKIVLLDDDRFDEGSKGQHATMLARELEITLIRQRPDHEGFILRHLSGREHERLDRRTSMERLKALWPEYRKPMVAADLEKKIDFAGLQRACSVEPELCRFLKELRFPV